MLNNPSSIPERILVFGAHGTGKTTCYLQIARYLKLSGSDAHVYIGDSDSAVPRMLGGGQYSDLDNVTLTSLHSWPDYERFAIQVASAGPHDWVCIDFIGSAWQTVQDHFTREIFNQNVGDYFLAVRKQRGADDKSLVAYEGWMDWPVINALYRQWVTPLLFQSHANIFGTARADELSPASKPTEDQTTRQLFHRFGTKPVGQKELPYQFHTLLLSARDARGQFVLNTVKDREREELRGSITANFVTDYLVKIGGWRLA